MECSIIYEVDTLKDKKGESFGQLTTIVNQNPAFLQKFKLERVVTDLSAEIYDSLGEFDTGFAESLIEMANLVQSGEFGIVAVEIRLLDFEEIFCENGQHETELHNFFKNTYTPAIRSLFEERQRIERKDSEFADSVRDLFDEDNLV